ncbi:M56 family metallopeptidase [Winogradskyella arenosi]|nr:M56 family metallopeptidase [Winogradskyella arenosi]
MTTKDMVIHLPEVFIGAKAPTVYEVQTAELAGIVLEQPQTPIWRIIAYTGIVIATLIFLVKIINLYWVKYKNPKRWKGNVLIVSLIKSATAYSFFNTIFLGERISETEKSTIYEHELVHIKELHTLDLLFFEVLRIIFWFNPLVYIYQNRIKELHEYIADAKAVKQSGISEYYKSLLNQVLDVNQASFTNAFFNSSLIKKRIVMLQKSKSKQLHLIKYALLIPMVFGMLIYTSTEVRAQEKTTEQEQVSDQELTEAELVEKYRNKILEMKKNGATFFEISDYAGMDGKSEERYIPSKTRYLKFKAYMQYIADGMIKRKTEDGTLSQSHKDTAELMSMDTFASYQEFRDFKNTKEEKERWEANTDDGVLKLFVEDTANKTEEETKRYNALLKQLENDAYFNKLVVTDGRSTLVLDSYISAEGEEVIKDEIVEIPFTVVEESPTTVECKDLERNEDRKDCLSMLVNKHISENFNTSVGDNLSPGRKRVFVQFKIDSDGTVKEIMARAPSPMLEEEAKRVIATLPQFIPGKQKGEIVVVPFSIPIVFEVASKAEPKKE